MVRKTRKRQVMLRNPITQSFSGDNAKSIYNTWKQDCRALKNDSIGVTGIKSGNNDLLDHVIKHVSSSIQRPTSPHTGDKDGVNFEVLKLLDKILNDDDIITEGDIDELGVLIKTLSKMNKSDLDPRNIPFTVPVPEGRGKFTMPEKPNTYGHYKTKNYVRARKARARRKQIRYTEGEAVAKKWANPAKNSAEPPMWQAIFKGGELITNGLAIVLVNSLKALQDTKIERADIRVLYDPSDLIKVAEFKKVLTDLVASPTTDYQGRLSPTRLVREMAKQVMPVTNEISSDLIKEAMNLTGDDAPYGQIQEFTVKVTNRMVIKMAKELNIIKKSFTTSWEELILQ